LKIAGYRRKAASFSQTGIDNARNSSNASRNARTRRRITGKRDPPSESGETDETPTQYG